MFLRPPGPAPAGGLTESLQFEQQKTTFMTELAGVVPAQGHSCGLTHFRFFVFLVTLSTSHLTELAGEFPALSPKPPSSASSRGLAVSPGTNSTNTHK